MEALHMHQFPFDNYLTHQLPDYDHEWNVIIAKIVLTSVLFIVILPMMFKSIFKVKTPKHTEETSSESDVNVKHTKRKNNNPKVKGATKTSTDKKRTKNEKDSSSSTEIITTSEVPLAILIIINLIYILILFGFIAASPNNIDTSRRVYQAPLLHKDECQMIIDMAERAARRNVENARKKLASLPSDKQNDEKDKDLLFFGEFEEEAKPWEEEKENLDKLLKWPEGWKKDRHEFYPTTDLNVVLDFQKQDLEKISKILHARLSPLLARIYGISKDSIRANDMFVVRYDGEGQSALRSHTDSSHVSFNILLNDEFVGGGTRFYDRLNDDHYDARPEPGDVLINNAMVRHEGLATTAGTRYIFVGFMNIDHKDPWTGGRTNVPTYATYFSFPWLTVSMKEFFDDERQTGGSARSGALGHLSQTQQMEFVSSAIACTMLLGDYFAPHGLVKLINGDKRRQYLDDLDEFYEENKNQLDKSIWFKGQQINLNVDGTFASEWRDRKGNEENFVEL